MPPLAACNCAPLEITMPLVLAPEKLKLPLPSRKSMSVRSAVLSNVPATLNWPVAPTAMPLLLTIQTLPLDCTRPSMLLSCPPSTRLSRMKLPAPLAWKV